MCACVSSFAMYGGSRLIPGVTVALAFCTCCSASEYTLEEYLYVLLTSPVQKMLDVCAVWLCWFHSISHTEVYRFYKARGIESGGVKSTRTSQMCSDVKT